MTVNRVPARQAAGKRRAGLPVAQPAARHAAIARSSARRSSAPPPVPSTRKGYHNTSLDDIAAALEVTKPTIYYYVKNKEQLLFECFVRRAGADPRRASARRGSGRCRRASG